MVGQQTQNNPALGGLFQPINVTGNGVPDVSESYIPTGVNIISGSGAPKPVSPKSNQQSPMQSLQELGTLGSMGNSAYGAGSSGLGSMMNGSAMSATQAADYNAANGLTAGSSNFASAGDTVGGLGDAASAFQSTPGLGDALEAAWAAFKSGGTVKHYDSGGNIESAPWYARREAQMPFHSTGMFNPNAGAGRTDNINTNVPSGSYVVPADVVSGLGEGNSMMGARVIQKMMGSGPYGTPVPQIAHGSGAPKPPAPLRYAKGGNVGEAVPIVAAGGEMLLHPRDIVNKFGDLKRGHKVLDKWVVLTRKNLINTLKKLPPPKG